MTEFFSKKLIKVINEIIADYNNTISQKFNIDKDELTKIWENGQTNVVMKEKVVEKVVEKVIANKTENKITEKNNEEESKKELNNLKRSELVELCKAKNLRYSGTKPQLIERLLNTENNDVSLPSTSSKNTKKSSPPVIQKIIKPDDIAFRRNQFGNFENEKTGLVSCNKTKTVYGKQNKDGTVDDLTEEDIELCNKYKLPYKMPENLDKNATLEDEYVEELDDIYEEEEEEDDVKEEIIEEEEMLEDDEDDILDDDDLEDIDEFEEEEFDEDDEFYE